MIVYIEILISLLIFAGFYFVVTQRYGKNPIEDLGVMWLTIVLIFCIPLPLGWALSGFDSERFSDRLYNLHPTINDFSYGLASFICLEIGFIAAYLLFLRPRVSKINSVRKLSIPPHILKASAVLFAVTWALSFYIRVAYIGNVTDYLDVYVLARNIPLWLGQSLKMIDGVLGITKVILLVYGLQNWSKFRILILAYVLLEIVLYDPTLDRSGLMLSLYLVLICYHMIVHTISARAGFILAILFILTFSVLGGIRATMAGAEAFPEFSISSIGESEGYWTNALHLYSEKKIDPSFFPAYIRFSEFYSFIPSQFLGFEKLDPSNWYMMTYYPAAFALGQGLTFGVLSQLTAGDGLGEGLIRGFVLGLFYAQVMNLFIRNRTQWWALPSLAFILVGLYGSVRVSSFTLLSSFIQIIVPSMLVVYLLALFFAYWSNIRVVVRATH